MNDHPTPDGGAVETVGQALTDLAEVYERLPLLADPARADAEQTERSARQLDRLAEEISEAAAMVRGTFPGAGIISAAGDVRVAEARRHLAAFPPDPDLPAMPPAALVGWAARMHTSAMLLDAWIHDREQAADPRIVRARSLAAEHHQPVLMTPGDVRHLLARYQRGVVELLAVIDGEPARRPSGRKS
jgi:hypothetical protein